MGLFSFIKGAGEKLFGGKKEAEKEVEDYKITALKKAVQALGIPVQGLDVELAQQVIVKGQTATSADREKLILALGNVDGVGSVEDNITVTNPEPVVLEPVFHEVQSGDTLSKISKEVYGDPMKYNEIFEANKPMLDHPDKIYPGQLLRIPNLN
ncbi:MAG: peptidoglycan-binding protein LysM [Flavobacteriales bacterium]|nr:peptidoglycan-binding protein LysM [Flavobacteriales bacterium]